MTNALTRRTFIGGTAGAVALTALAAATARAASDLRVYVLVVDGCRPDEATGAYLPTLRSLAAQGTSFASARSIPIAETIPNHVAMMSGVYPQRSGVPANSIYDRTTGEVRDLGLATDLTRRTCSPWMRWSARTTTTTPRWRSSTSATSTGSATPISRVRRSGCCARSC